MWSMLLQHTEQNYTVSNEELYIGKDALYAPESTTNTPESQTLLERNAMVSSS